jgi:ubiquinone/menaquinone biosynthesis C-methylase UbiE
MTAQSITEQSDALRARLRSMWSAVAPAWGQNTEYLDTRGAAVTARMLELTAPEPGERILELACGPASVGLAAAPLVGPSGEVVLSDVVPEMTSIAEARAGGLANVRVRVLDMEEVDEPDASYDAVLCREGLMLVPEPELAAREIGRVLRPGGRAAIAVWGPRERNPWLGLVFRVVSEQLGTPMPPPGVPHPFSLDDAGQLAGVLSAAGLADVSVDEVDAPYVAASVDEWWQRSSSLAGPLAQKLAALPEPQRQALRQRAADAVDEYRTGEGLELPGVALVAFGRS